MIEMFIIQIWFCAALTDRLGCLRTAVSPGVHHGSSVALPSIAPPCSSLMSPPLVSARLCLATRCNLTARRARSGIRQTLAEATCLTFTAQSLRSSSQTTCRHSYSEAREGNVRGFIQASLFRPAGPHGGFRECEGRSSS